MRSKAEIDIEKAIADYDICIAFSCLSGICRGCCHKTKRGYIVLIEESLSAEAATRALRHEVLHIVIGHLDDDIKTEDEKELEVKRYFDRLESVEIIEDENEY